MKELQFSRIKGLEEGKTDTLELQEGGSVKLPTHQMTKGDREALEKLLKERIG